MLDDKGQFALDEAFTSWLKWLVKAQEEPMMILNSDYATLFDIFARGEAAYFIGNSAELLTLKDKIGDDALGTAMLPRGPEVAGSLMDLEVISVSQQTVQKKTVPAAGSVSDQPHASAQAGHK